MLQVSPGRAHAGAAVRAALFSQDTLHGTVGEPIQMNTADTLYTTVGGKDLSCGGQFVLLQVGAVQGHFIIIWRVLDIQRVQPPDQQIH